jgi:hypothetical protein
MEDDSVDKPAADNLDAFPGIVLSLRRLRRGSQRAEQKQEN